MSFEDAAAYFGLGVVLAMSLTAILCVWILVSETPARTLLRMAMAGLAIAGITALSGLTGSGVAILLRSVVPAYQLPLALCIAILLVIAGLRAFWSTKFYKSI